MKIKLKLFLQIIMSLIIITPAVSVLITGAVSIFGFSSNMMKEQTETVIYSQTAGFELILDEYISGLKTTSGLEAVIETAEWKYSNVKDEIINLTKNITQNNKNILDIIITNREGIICADYKGRPAGSIYSGFNENVSVISRNETYFSDISVKNAEYNDLNTFYIVHQIYNGDNAAGFIAMVINVECFNIYLEETSFFNGGNIFIIDSKGTALNFNNEPVTRSEEISGSLKDLITEVRGTRRSMTLNNNYEVFNKEGYIGSYGNISTTSWIWFGVYPNSTINTIPLSDFIGGLIIVASLTIILMSFMIIVSRNTFKPFNSIVKQLDTENPNSCIKIENIQNGSLNDFKEIAFALNTLSDNVKTLNEMQCSATRLSNNILFELDIKNEQLYVSDNFKDVFNIIKEYSGLQSLEMLIISDEKEKFKYNFAKLLKTNEQSGTNIKTEHRMITKFGEYIWVSIQAQVKADRIIGLITDINNEKKLSLQLSEHSSYDFLSQLYDKNTFERKLQQELERIKCLWIIFIDIEDFKSINEKYGYFVGDKIIKHVSDTITNTIKGGGFAGRFGGEEFVICLTGEKLINDIEKFASDFLNELTKFHNSDGENIQLKASLGISVYPEHGENSVKLIAAADEAMYLVKKTGKRDYNIYNRNSEN